MREAPKPCTCTHRLWTEGGDIRLGDRQRARLIAERDVRAGRCQTDPFQLAALKTQNGLVGKAEQPSPLIRRRYRTEPRAKPADLGPVCHDVVKLDLDRVARGKAKPRARHTMNARACDTLKSLEHTRGVPG